MLRWAGRGEGFDVLQGGELGMGAIDILIGAWMQWRQGVLDAGGINWQSRHHT
jgi:hypothetical protein